MSQGNTAGMPGISSAAELSVAGLFGRLLAGLNLVASTIVIGLMLLITADVICRVAFGFPFHGVPEITKLSLVTMLWLQIAHTLRQREHLRSTLILSRLPASGQRAVLLVNCAAGAFMMGLIAWYGADEMLRAWRINAFEGEHPVRVPTWPIWVTLVAGAGLTSCEYVWQALRALRAADVRSEIARDGVSFE